jgi:hypothetical protein
VAAYFESVRREQQSWANITQAKLNLKDTTVAAFRVLDSLHLRGQQLDNVEERGEVLVESSRIFATSLMPWWKRWLRCMCLPKWWFQCKASPPEKALPEAQYVSIEFI